MYVQPPALNIPDKKVFWINGWEHPRLLLTRGKKYQFNIMTCGYPFYFTTDPEGGHGNINNIMGITPSDWDLRTYTIGKGIPSKFYYQSTGFPGMGGEVIVLEK